MQNDPLEGLGRAIRILRTAQNLERKELAERAGISYPYLAEIESGRKRASTNALVSIAQALGVAPHDLLAQGAEVAETYPLARPDEMAELAAPPPMPARSVTAAGIPPPAAMPVAARPAAPRASRWFGPKQQAPPPPAPPEGVDELVALARQLGPDDLRLVIELARRLRG